MRKQWLYGAVIVLLAGGAGVAVLASKGAGSKQEAGDKNAVAALEFRPSEVVQPLRAAMPGLIEFSGPLVAPGTVVVRSKSGGTLLSLAVGEGSRVRAGQALGQADLEEQRLRVAERNASLESARAQLAQAERHHRANEGLAAQNFVAPTALETSRAALEAARAQLRVAQAQLDTSQVGLRQAALVSPINGLVAKRHVLPSEKLTAEQAILTIVDLSRLELAGLVGTHEVSRLQPGMPVQVRIEGVDQPVQAQIARIAPAAEAGTRSIVVTLELANSKEQFRAGQYAVARVELPDERERMTVPQTAVSSNAGQEQVWLIEQGALVRRIITTGRRDAREGRVEVLEGLSAESQVLAARYDNLREGSKATVMVGKQPAAVASAASGANRAHQ